MLFPPNTGQAVTVRVKVRGWVTLYILYNIWKSSQRWKYKNVYTHMILQTHMHTHTPLGLAFSSLSGSNNSNMDE